MLRRRRLEREKIAFGFDSFLDLVANVIGIVIRLILVAWVGARFYSAAMDKQRDSAGDDTATAVLTASKRPEAPKSEPDPLEGQIAQAQRELDQVRRELAERLTSLDQGRKRHLGLRTALDSLRDQEMETQAALAGAESSLAAWRLKAGEASRALDLVQQRGRDLLAEIQTLEKTPRHTKELRYFAPVSRVVDDEELMFECRAGRVTYVDVPAFLHEIKGSLDEKRVQEIARRGSFTGTTQAIGSFRVRYQFDAEQDLFSAAGRIRVQLTRWVLEPVTEARGERAEQALAAGSDFRRLVDGIDPQFTTVTFWVYPDSFPLYRALRDYLAEQGVEVAARPLPSGLPIAGSIHGSRSHGQ